MSQGDPLFRREPSRNGTTRATVAALAAHKRLDEAWLRKRFSLSDEANGLRIPYANPDGTRARARLRENTETSQPTKWIGAGEMTVYVAPGALGAERGRGELVIEEGESDCWTLELHGVPALGVPGSGMAQLIAAEHVAGLKRVLIMREPGKSGATFVRGVTERLREVGFDGEVLVIDLQATCGVKDPSALHVRDPQTFKSEWKRAVEAAERFPAVIDWPPLYPQPQLDPAALHGLAGEIVQYLDPLVEATPIGMLLELLCAFGNAAGPASYALVGDDMHPARLFVCLVGPTSTGGKGNADAAIRPFIRAMDDDWFAAARASGFGVNGQRHSWPGRKPRSPEPSSPAQDERQSRVFDLHVEGRSLREIAKLLGIDRGTASLDVQMEGQRRADERAHERGALIEASCRRYESVLWRANLRIEQLMKCVGGKGEATSDATFNPVAARAIVEQERIILTALTRLDELLGLTYEPSRRF